MKGGHDSPGGPGNAGPPGVFRRLFLRLYPRRLRERHGPEMAALLQRRLARGRASGGLPAVGREWARAWGDLVLTRAQELLARRGRGRSRQKAPRAFPCV